MSTFVTLDANDHVRRVQVLRSGASPQPGALLVVLLPSKAVFAPGADEVGLHLSNANREIGTMMRVGGILQPRPVTPEPTWDGSEITIPPVPEGTVIELFDLAGGERMAVLSADAEGWTETVSLPDAGTYEIELQAPGDFLPASLRIMI
ncbi:hypothetical protein [Roseicyclus sp.]|uniref:hypothetical protein n=1 Tax=Roseicyclus sp. TaxID=1914329 RepID=UPI003F6D387C